MAYKLPNPERERTEKNRELKRLRTKEEPGPERAARAAELAVWFHDERSINHVMELAQLVLGDLGDDEGADVLIEAYLDSAQTEEDRMEQLASLANVGRWIDHEGLLGAARRRAMTAAAGWVGSVADEVEQAERLSLVQRRFDEDFRKAVQQAL